MVTRPERLCAWCYQPFHSTNPKAETCCATHGAQLSAKRRSEVKAEEERRKAESDAGETAWAGVVFPSYRMKPCLGKVEKPAAVALGQSSLAWVKE